VVAILAPFPNFVLFANMAASSATTSNTNSQRTEYARSPVVIGRKFHIRQAAGSQRVFSDCDKYSGERSRFTLPAAGCARIRPDAYLCGSALNVGQAPRASLAFDRVAGFVGRNGWKE
jgi:hypothetical protein